MSTPCPVCRGRGAIDYIPAELATPTPRPMPIGSVSATDFALQKRTQSCEACGEKLHKWIESYAFRRAIYAGMTWAGQTGCVEIASGDRLKSVDYWIMRREGELVWDVKACYNEFSSAEKFDDQHYYPDTKRKWEFVLRPDGTRRRDRILLTAMHFAAMAYYAHPKELKGWGINAEVISYLGMREFLHACDFGG